MCIYTCIYIYIMYIYIYTHTNANQHFWKPMMIWQGLLGTWGQRKSLAGHVLQLEFGAWLENGQ